MRPVDNPACAAGARVLRREPGGELPQERQQPLTDHLSSATPVAQAPKNEQEFRPGESGKVDFLDQRAFGTDGMKAIEHCTFAQMTELLSRELE
jgi:hypothetical protein